MNSERQILDNSSLITEDSYDLNFTNTDTTEHNQINFSYGLTNARSLWQKTDDLATYMQELDLTFTIITETWFYDCEALRALETNILHGNSIAFLHRSRKKKERSNPGWGDSIAYAKSKISLRE